MKGHFTRPGVRGPTGNGFAETACYSLMKQDYTQKQGQYLAFISYYGKINGRPPAETDLQRYFKVTPSTVHQMILRLEQRGLIERVPGQSRTIRVLLPREELPNLE